MTPCTDVRVPTPPGGLSNYDLLRWCEKQVGQQLSLPTPYFQERGPRCIRFRDAETGYDVRFVWGPTLAEAH